MKPIAVFWGKVKDGQKRGKTLGFPTANLPLHKKIPEGIYAATVRIGGRIYQSAVFIGRAETFGEKDYKAEAYILDFSQNIYNRWMSVLLYKKLRGNKKFTSKEQLISQMENDVLATREFFGKSF